MWLRGRVIAQEENSLSFRWIPEQAAVEIGGNYGIITGMERVRIWLELNSKEGKAIWDKYFEQEKAIYQQLLAAPEKVVSGTVQELADKYGMELNYMVGFLDGINESLKRTEPNRGNGS